VDSSSRVRYPVKQHEQERQSEPVVRGRPYRSGIAACSLKDLDATELAAMAVILRGDPDHKVGFDKDKRELAGGFDLP
jgi:hypothetical protein